MNNENAVSIIDQTDIVSFQNTMRKIEQFQRLVRENLKEGKDYGTIPGTSKPTLYKPGAEKIIILGKLRSTFDLLSETKDYEKEFFQFVMKCSLWLGDTLITQGVGLCNSKEDKFRYRWVSEKKLPSNLDKGKLIYRDKTGKYGKYREYRIENNDICSIANTILKMSKKRSLVDAALLVGSLSDLFTQDIEDLPEEYLNNKETENKGNPEEKPAILKQKEEIKSSLKKHIESNETKLEKKAEINSKDVEEIFKLLNEVNIMNWSQGLYYARKANIKVGDTLVATIPEVKKLLTEDKDLINRIVDAREVDKPAGPIEKHWDKENKLERQKREMEDDITDEDLGITSKQPGVDS